MWWQRTSNVPAGPQLKSGLTGLWRPASDHVSCTQLQNSQNCRQGEGTPMSLLRSPFILKGAWSTSRGDRAYVGDEGGKSSTEALKRHETQGPPSRKDRTPVPSGALIQASSLGLSPSSRGYSGGKALLFIILVIVIIVEFGSRNQVDKFSHRHFYLQIYLTDPHCKDFF